MKPLSDKAPVYIGERVAGKAKRSAKTTRGDLMRMVTAGYDPVSGTEMCFREQQDRNVILDFLVDDRPLGSKSKFGEAYRMCAPYQCTKEGCSCSQGSVAVAVKVIPLKTADYVGWNRARPHSSELITSSAVWAELTAMTLANEMVLQNVCPNLPLMFRWFVCPTCTFRDETRPKGECAIVFNELASSDLNAWCSGRQASNDEIASLSFQIFAGVFAMKRYYGLQHNDLHAGNVLVHKLPEEHRSGVFEYIIDGKHYYVPHQGWLFVIWDFGKATIEDRDTKVRLGTKSRPNEDLHRISRLLLSFSNEQSSHFRNFHIPPESAGLLRSLDSPTFNLLSNVFFRLFGETRTADSVWNMDKALSTFPDADLEALVIRDPVLTGDRR